MSLEPIVLDDLTWEQMTAAIRRRIPAESDGRWTLHAPVDPGITILELYAALLEERLYWMDRVPDAFAGSVLRLLHLDQPRGAVPAATVLRIADPPPGTVVPAGTSFQRDPRSPAPFTIDTPVTVLPVREIRLRIDGQDRTADLHAQVGVRLLPAGGGAGAARIGLVLSGPLDPAPDSWVSLLVDLKVTDRDRTPPGWLPTAVPGVPPPADITWAYEDPSGGTPAFGASDVEDGTQGLRRSGVVRLRIPEAWRGGPGERVLIVRTERGMFSSPPTLTQLAVNVAVAVQRLAVQAGDDLRLTLGTTFRDGWRPLPGQRLALPPETRGTLLTATLRLRERDGRSHDWAAADDFTLHGPDAQVFRLDRATGALTFGDGRTGRIPVLSAGDPEPITALGWQIGGGTAGNGGLTTNWHAGDGIGVDAANVVPAEGGQDPETTAQARIRVSADLRRRHRAVTRADHETVARETPGVHVGRAVAVVGDAPGRSCPVPGTVSVYVFPGVPRSPAGDWPDVVAAPAPDPGMLHAVRDGLDRARLAGTEVFVREPRYRHVRLLVELGAAPADPAATRRRIESALRRYLDPLVGGDRGEGWPIGDPLRPSALVRVVQRTGADVRRVRVALDEEGAEAGEDCVDVPIGRNEVVVLDHLRVQLGGGAR